MLTATLPQLTINPVASHLKSRSLNFYLALVTFFLRILPIFSYFSQQPTSIFNYASTDSEVYGFGQALYLTTSGQGISFPGDLYNLQEFTAEAWVKKNCVNVPAGGEFHVFRKRENTDLPYNDTFSFFTYNGASSDDAVGRFGYQSGVQTITADHLQCNQWSHIALVNDPNNTSSQKGRLYVNGQLIGSANTTANLNYGNGPLYIGMHMPDTTSFYGNIDEIRISKTVRYSSNFLPPSLFPSPLITTLFPYFTLMAT